MIKQQPHDINAEMSTLGAMLIDPDQIDKLAGSLHVDDFYTEKHRILYRSLLTMASRGDHIDTITVDAELMKAGVSKQIGGAAYLVELMDACPVAAFAGNHAKLVVNRSQARNMLQAAQELSQAALCGDGNAITEAIDKAAAMLSTDSSRSKPRPSGDVILSSMRLLKKRRETQGQIQGIPYGFPELDQKTNGLHRGELVIVAGRPSMGKSAFAGNIAENTASNGYHVMFYSLEMSSENIIDRMLAGRAKIKYNRIRSGMFDDADWPRAQRSCGDITDWSLMLDDTPAIGLGEIRSKSKQQKRAKGLDVVIIDYLQLMAVSNRDNRVQAIGEISRGLKQLARELDCAVVLLSQLSRAVDSRPDKRPLMSDLRDSGEIEQDADVILFPFRPAAYCQKCKDRIDDGSHNLQEHMAVAELHIAKQRNGENNVSIPMTWLGDYQQFIERGSN